MAAYRTAARIDRTGRLVVNDIPFQHGDEVEVIVVSRCTQHRCSGDTPLRGKPLRYDRPTDPVAVGEWEALG